jgi:hypothetical protein
VERQVGVVREGEVAEGYEHQGEGAGCCDCHAVADGNGGAVQA